MPDAVYGADGVEMDAGHALRHEFAALSYAPFHPYLLHLLVGGTFLHFARQGFGDVYLECLGDDAELRELLQGFDAWDDIL